MAIQNQWQVSEQKLIVTLKLNRGIIWWAKQMHIHKPNHDWHKPIERVAADKLISEAGDIFCYINSVLTHCYYIYTLLTKWKVNLNFISTEFPCDNDGSFIIVWSTVCPPHDQSQLSAHKSYFMPATFLRRQDKSLISTVAALAYCADNHCEMSGTKQSRTLQHPNYTMANQAALS